jgi:hypothetical protein
MMTNNVIQTSSPTQPWPTTSEFNQSINNSDRDDDVIYLPNKVAQTSSSTLPSPMPPTTKLNQDADKTSTSADGCLCVVCLTNKSTYAFVPCGHLALCEECAGKFDEFEQLESKCPICRMRYRYKVRVYKI